MSWRSGSAIFYSLTLGLALPFLLSSGQTLLNRINRASKLPPKYERVLILGASSGIGRSIAHIYAQRGARVCLVSRRGAELEAVAEECRALMMKGGHDEYQAGGKRVISVVADFSEVADMINVRTPIETEWRGLDTLVVAAGVSSLRPLMEVAGVEQVGPNTFRPTQADAEGIQKAVDAASIAIDCNYVGPLIASLTFIPLLTTTSPSPSILLISSLASVVPPPTRSLYASTKCASLSLYRTLAIEHPSIAFSYLIPSTVEGNFRGSAVDAGPVREDNPNKVGLRRETVAQRAIDAIDGGEKMVFIPAFYKFAEIANWVFPAFVEWRARKKYKFPATQWGPESEENASGSGWSSLLF